MNAFARFPPRLQEAIVARVGWTSLHPVQDLALAYGLMPELSERLMRPLRALVTD